MEFKDKIRKIREEAGLSQRQMAEKLYLTRTVISKWENGTRYPNYQEMTALKRVFNVSVDSLFGEEDNDRMPEVEPIMQQDPEITVQSMLLMGIEVLNVICFMFKLKDYLNDLGNKGNISFELMIHTVYELAAVLILGYCIYKSFNVEVTKRTVITVMIVGCFGHLLTLVTGFLTEDINYLTVLDFAISFLIMLYLLYFFMKSDCTVSKYPIIVCGIQIQIYLIELYGSISQSFAYTTVSNGLIYDISDFGRKVLLVCFLIPQITVLSRKRKIKIINY